MGVARGYATWVVRLRWPVLLAVGAITWAAVSMLSGVAAAGGQLSFLGDGGPAIRAQEQAVARFGLPLLSRTAVVQRDPAGLNPYTAARSVLHALEIDQQTATTGPPPGQDLLVALPLINVPLLVPGAGEQNTTIVTYLFTDPTVDIFGQNRAALAYAAQIEPRDALVGVTGTIPTQIEKGGVIAAKLPLVETVTLAAIALIVGLNFRSVLAPVVTLVTAGAGYLLADRAIGTLAGLTGLSAPAELEPIVVALMLGVTTDYSIFFLSGMQRRLRSGTAGRSAARGAVREYLPIVATAGVTVASGVAALLVARSGLFRSLGPGLAVTVLVGLAVAVTVVPAMMGILGRWAFWPSRLPAPLRTDGPTVPPAADPPAADPSDGPARSAGPTPAVHPSRRTWLIRRLADRRTAAVVAGVAVAVLVALALPLGGLRSSVSPADALPAGNPVRMAADAATSGFTPGILSPTELIVSAPGIAGRPDALSALGAQLRRQTGVDIVLGPATQPLPLLRPLPRQLGLFLAPDGGAARYLVAFDGDALGATAIGHLRELQDALPSLLAAAGLGDAEVALAGDTAVGLSLVDQANADLGRVAIAVGLVSLVLLVLFLRALVAPLYLLISSVLAVGAALGLTTLVFQGLLHRDGLIFYVPFAAAVLLVSLGSDYNIFSVGYIWERARERPLREALVVAVPRSTRAITTAGIALAASFAVVALVPLAAFQELAFAMAVGVLIDAFLVRSVLVPALISFVGTASGWPGRRLAQRAPQPD